MWIEYYWSRWGLCNERRSELSLYFNVKLSYIKINNILSKGAQPLLQWSLEGLKSLAPLFHHLCSENYIELVYHVPDCVAASYTYEYLIVRSVSMIHVESHGAFHVHVNPGKRTILAQLIVICLINYSWGKVSTCFLAVMKNQNTQQCDKHSWKLVL